MVRYTAAVLLAAIAIAIKLSLRAAMGTSFPFLILFTAVVLAAWIGGLGPGILTTFLAAASTTLLLRSHRASFPVEHETIGTVVFWVEGVLVSILSEARARAANERGRLLELERAARQQAELTSSLQQQSERTLAQFSARSAATVQNALDCIVSMDHAGMVVEWNPASERTFGYSREQALGRALAELIIPPGYRDAHRVGLAHYLSTGEGRLVGKRVEIAAVRQDGLEIPVELSICPIPGEDPPLFIGFLRDITDRKNADAERERLLASERTARAEAERSSRTKDEFLATLSHELRTPLNAILGWSQLLKLRTNSDPELAEGLAVIERNTRAQTRLVEDLLDMSRIVVGKVRLDVQCVSLVAMVESAVAAVQPTAAAKGVLLQQAIDPAAPAIRGDPNRLHQVVLNLLSNAIKFTPTNGQVTTTLTGNGDGVEITVTDTGEGIAPEFLPHMFERFRQADGSTTRQHGGLGLGLAIARHLVELHGGTLSAASEGLGRGAQFRVRLPLAAAPLVDHPERAVSVAAPAGHGKCLASLAGVRVLVVDDDPDARELLGRVLESAHAEVLTAESASRARELIHAAPPHALVSDLGMPGEDGYQLVQNLAQAGADGGRAFAAIALTALARPEDRARAIRCGFDAYLAKPVDPAELVSAVARLVGREIQRPDPAVIAGSPENGSGPAEQ